MRTLLHAHRHSREAQLLNRGTTLNWIADRYRARLKQMRRVELIRGGVTMVGPHRDDISFQLDGVDIATYGSQGGQQRSAVLAAKLAEAHFIRAHTGEMPVLLLDDVLSELDERRRTNLLREIIGSTQVLVTSVEPGCRDLMPDGASVFTIVAGGEVTPDDVAPPQRCAGKSMDKMGYTARIRAASAMQVWNNEIAPRHWRLPLEPLSSGGETLYITVEKPVWPNSFP